MAAPQLARFICQYCGRSYDEGRKLGGHVRQAHQKILPVKSPLSGEGEMAARVLEMWREGTDPYKIVISLRVHPLFVRSVLKEYDELLNEWKNSSEAEKPPLASSEPARPRSQAERDERVI